MLAAALVVALALRLFDGDDDGGQTAGQGQGGRTAGRGASPAPARESSTSATSCRRRRWPTTEARSTSEVRRRAELSRVRSGRSRRAFRTARTAFGVSRATDASLRQRRCSSYLQVGRSHAPRSCLCTGRSGCARLAPRLSSAASAALPERRRAHHRRTQFWISRVEEESVKPLGDEREWAPRRTYGDRLVRCAATPCSVAIGARFARSGAGWSRSSAAPPLGSVADLDADVAVARAASGGCVGCARVGLAAAAHARADLGAALEEVADGFGAVAPEPLVERRRTDVVGVAGAGDPLRAGDQLAQPAQVGGAVARQLRAAAREHAVGRRAETTARGSSCSGIVVWSCGPSAVWVAVACRLAASPPGRRARRRVRLSSTSVAPALLASAPAAACAVASVRRPPVRVRSQDAAALGRSGFPTAGHDQARRSGRHRTQGDGAPTDRRRPS